MKTKLFTFLTLLLCVCSGAWGATVSYSGTALTTTTHKVGSDTKTFLDLTDEITNAQIKNGASTFALGLHYITTLKPVWATGSGASSTTSSTAATDDGFLAYFNNSSYDAYTQAYGCVQIKSSQQTVLYVTGITSLATFGKDNNTSDNKQLIIKVAEIASDGTVGTEYSTTSSASTSDHVTAYSGSTLSGTAFYRITLTTGSTGACNTYQIRFTPYVNPNPTFSLTKSIIGNDETSQIRVGKKSGLDGITLNNPASSNTAVATVNSAGLITGLKAGTADITFTSNAVTGKYNAVAETQTLTVTVKEMLSVSAYLSATANTPTTTNCTFKYYGTEGSVGSVPAGTSYNEGEYYYSKMNGDANYYEITPTSGTFQAGDIVTVYLYGNGTTGAYKIGKTKQTSVSETITKLAVTGVTHTLAADEIESDGTVRIYRNSSNTYFAGVTIRGEREPSLTISAQPESAAYATGASATALSVTASPYYDGGALTYQWYSNTTESTEGASAIPSATSSTYMPSTASAGTTYYYCVVTESAISCSITTDIVSVLVSASHTIDISVADGQSSWGTVSPSGETSALGGSSLEVTATPETGYKFQKWVIDGSDNTANPYTFSDIAGDHTIVAHFAARKSVNYTITESQKGTRNDIYVVDYANDADKFTTSASNKYLNSANQTMTGWSDGSTTYGFNVEIDLTDGNKTLTPVFADNDGATFAATLEASKSNFTVTWNLGNNYSDFNVEQKTAYYIQQATINTKSVDVPMYINATSGIFNNQGDNAERAQVNGGTVLTVPVVNGSVITIVAYHAFGTTDRKGQDCIQTTINGVTTYDTSTNDGKTAIYTYSGSTGTIDIAVGGDAAWIYTISVSYPTTFSPAPTMAAGTFSFANKAYPVTITGETGTTKIETSVNGGTTWTEQELTALTCTVNVTAGQTLLARATVGSKGASEEVSFTNEFDSGKSYVAWVYTKGYGSAGYTFAADPMVVALQSVYNVVEVDGGTSAPNADWKNADLIICSEAMQGNNNLSNGMVTLLDGTTPMIGLKAYNYGGTQTRWGWGTPANPSETVYGFTPKSNIYALLDGVTYEEDGTIKLATGRYNSGSQKNVVQTVNFDGASVPSDNVIMGNIDDADSKAVMHYSATMKYFGLGLSSDCHSYYTPSAIAIVKNAAAMLIAGKVLTEEAKTVSGTITASGWNTFSSSYPLDLSTITATSDVVAYYASNAADSKVTLAETGATVPAGEGLMIKGEAGETFTIDVAGSGTAIDGNLLVGLPAGGTVAANANNYVFGWADEKEPGFYFVNSTEPTLGLGKAYLHTTTTLGARLNFFFDDETTGITNNNREDITNNREYFNLAGQRVDQPAKGLYIVNGKKVVVK